MSWTGAGCQKSAKTTIGDLEVVHPAPLQWQELEPGLEFSRLSFVRKSNQERIELAALRVDPRRFKFGLIRASELLSSPAGEIPDMAGKSQALAAVNASFYLPDTYQPIGLLVSAGKTLNAWKKKAGSGVFLADAGSVEIAWSKKYDPAWEKKELAVQAGPLLLEPDRHPGIYSNGHKYENRTAVGVDGAGWAMLVCALRQDEEGQSLAGLDLYELMKIASQPASAGGLGLTAALNLDGGISTSMAIRHPKLSLEVPSLRPVSNGIAVFRR
jgi:exopolysaccharide biosynthesis protein